MKFTKMHGAGNDYIFLNCLAGMPEDPAALARRLSDRHFGPGADGLICLCPGAGTDFSMRMFNADGSQGEMCGNGIRCLAKFAFDQGLTRQTTLTIATPAGAAAGGAAAGGRPGDRRHRGHGGAPGGGAPGHYRKGSDLYRRSRVHGQPPFRGGVRRAGGAGAAGAGPSPGQPALFSPGGQCGVCPGGGPGPGPDAGVGAGQRGDPGLRHRGLRRPPRP